MRRITALAVIGLTLLGFTASAQEDKARPAEASEVTALFPRGNLVIETALGRLRLNIEIARTREQQSRGLMFRPSLKADSGMIFLYDPPREIFMWMKNTILSLDMVFIAEDGRITRILANTIPLSETVIPSRGPVRAVLELPAGAAKRLAIKPGDVVRLDSLTK